MKKFLALLLVVSLVAVMFVFAACNNEGDDKQTDDAGAGTGTNAPAGNDGTETPAGTDGTEAPAETTAAPAETTAAPAETDGEPEENMYPYDAETHDVLPLSVLSWEDGGFGYGAPDETSIYLPVAPENVIHDGKGTWQNQTGSIATMVFDMVEDTFYDCDENCGDENNEDMNYGMYDFDNWDGDTTKTGYVGAYFEQGVKLTQIRWLARSGDGAERNKDGYFEASEDGTTWTLLHTIEENHAGDFTFVDIPEEYQDVAYKYIRYVGPDEGYCNMAEIEFWGSYAA